MAHHLQLENHLAFKRPQNKRVLGTGGFEPPTSCASSKRSPPELRAYKLNEAEVNLSVGACQAKKNPDGN